MNKFDGLLSLKDAAELIGVSPDYLRAEIIRGNLIEGTHCMKYGKQWVVNKIPFLNKYSHIDKKFELLHEDNVVWVCSNGDKVIGSDSKEAAYEWIEKNGNIFLTSGAIFI